MKKFILIVLIVLNNLVVVAMENLPFNAHDNKDKILVTRLINLAFQCRELERTDANFPSLVQGLKKQAAELNKEVINHKTIVDYDLKEKLLRELDECKKFLATKIVKKKVLKKILKFELVRGCFISSNNTSVGKTNF